MPRRTSRRSDCDRAIGHNGAVNSAVKRCRTLLAVAATVTGCMLLTGCVSTVTGLAVRDRTAAPVDVPPLKESQLDRVLLTVRDINSAMGSSDMEITSELDQMTDHSRNISDPDCLGAIYGAEEPVYDGSGWTSVRDQVAREPEEDNQHWVEQTVVLYPGADKAQRFWEKSKATWKKCGGSAVSVDDGQSTYTWQLDDLESQDQVITQRTTQEDAGGWECQHAMSYVSNVTVEAWACSYGIHDEAASIVATMVDNASKKK